MSVRYKHKSLLVTGLVFIGVSAFGCYVAVDYNMMLLFFSLVGIGGSMVFPMTMTLVGGHYPQEKRSGAVGWLIAGNSLSCLVGAPLIAYLADLGSWRTSFLTHIVPIAVLSIALVMFGFPTQRGGGLSRGSKVDYTSSFKAVFTNKSAISCLTGSALIMASYQAILVYSASFYRQVFSISRSFASMFVIGGALFFTVGSVGSAKLVNRFGRKAVTVYMGLVAGAMIAAYTIIPNLWFSAAIRFLGGLFMALSFSALTSLTLEQMPRYRGTLMSFNSAIGYIGEALGAFI
ncbi:MAG: MFS transporter, partial [Candidatus Bathyarchaeota archaeon]